MENYLSRVSVSNLKVSGPHFVMLFNIISLSTGDNPYNIKRQYFTLKTEVMIVIYCVTVFDFLKTPCHLVS